MQEHTVSGKRNNNSKDNISVVKTPSSVSMVKISLELNHEIKWKQNNDGIDLI